MAPPKDIARSYPKRGLTADVGFRSEPKFCGDGSTDFDGSADKVTAAHYNPSGDYLTTTAWVNADTLRNQGLIHNGNTGRNAFLFYMGGTGGLIFYWNDTTGDAYIAHQTTLTTGQWYHLAAVMDMSDPADHQVTFYIDGIAATGTRTAGGWVGDNTYQFGNQYSSAGWFDGKIANCRIYDAALTQDQIRELYNNPGLDFPSGLTASNLRRHYKLETDFNDSGADSQNATASGSPSFTVDRPQLPRGLDLARGAAQARVYTGRCLDQDGSVDRLQGTNFTDATTTACTVSFWMYQRDGGPGRIVHNFGGGATAVDRFIAFMSSGYFLIAGEITSGNRLGFSISNLPLNQWHHVAFVLDGNNTTSLSTTILYLNGEKYDSPGAVGVIWDTTTFDIGGTVHGYQNQLIAGVKVFNTKLTDAQARELYHNPEQVLPTGVSASNLRRYYPLSDYNDTGGTGGRYFQDMGADGEPLEDIGSSSMAFAQPVPCPQLGLQQSASRIYFDGSGGSSTGPRWDASISTAPGATWALAYWIWYDSSLPSYSMVIEGGGTQHYIQTTGTIVWNDGGAGYFNGAFPSSKQDRWTHVVMTSTAASPYVKCYVDGVEQTISTGAGDGDGLTVTSFSVFARAATPTGFHKGFCANMAIFDDALSSDEVTELFNQGIGYDLRNDTGDYASSADLLNYWLFDDLTSVVDRKGSNNLTNPTSTAFSEMASFPENASGSTIVGDFSLKRKGVSVLNFAESDNAAEAVIPAQSSLFPNATGYTISVWVKGRRSGQAGYVIQSVTTTTLDRVSVATQTSNEWVFEFPRISGSSSSVLCPLTYDGEWHCMTATIESATNTIKTYTDGILQVTSAAAVVNTAATPSNIRINPDASTYWSGVPVALLKISQQTWTDDEVQRNYYSDLRLIKGLANE
jgi:hypothetical protein